MNPQPNMEIFKDWPNGKREEIITNWNNRQVGSRVVSETDELRIWHLELEPGERAPFHRHDENYFWTVTGPGTSRSYYGDGTVKEVTYKAGDTMHFNLSKDEFFVHDLENTGESTLMFVTVEFKGQ